jgi:hypothetical protein
MNQTALDTRFSKAFWMTRSKELYLDSTSTQLVVANKLIPIDALDNGNDNAFRLAIPPRNLSSEGMVK